MRRVALSLLVLAAGCEPDDVELPLAERGKTRVLVFPTHITFDPYSTETPCTVLGGDAVATYDSEIATLVAPGGLTTESGYHHDWGGGWSHSTVRVCEPTIWDVPYLPVRREDLTVTIADASASYRATFAGYNTPLSLMFVDASVVDGHEVQTFRVEPATHVFWAHVVTALDGREVRTGFSVQKDGPTVKIRFPLPTDDVPPGPYALHMTWWPGTSECVGFAECTVVGRDWNLDHPIVRRTSPVR